ncbi:hypothetical protein nvc1_052 [Namao virus]|nr:hypothetical protein nvc1_052 [Namao virus]
MNYTKEHSEIIYKYMCEYTGPDQQLYSEDLSEFHNGVVKARDHAGDMIRKLSQSQRDSGICPPRSKLIEVYTLCFFDGLTMGKLLACVVYSLDIIEMFQSEKQEIIDALLFVLKSHETKSQSILRRIMSSFV